MRRGIEGTSASTLALTLKRRANIGDGRPSPPHAMAHRVSPRRRAIPNVSPPIHWQGSLAVHPVPPREILRSACFDALLSREEFPRAT